MFAAGIVVDEESAAAVGGSLAAVKGALADHQVGDYANFVEQPVDASRFFDDVSWARLREVKAALRPGCPVQGNHHVPPAA